MGVKRIKWLDWANVLAMACVVWFHVPSALELPVRHAEYVIVNVTFFILSGFSFSLTGYQAVPFRQFVRRIAQRLILPTAVFYFAFYVLWLIVGKRLGGDVAEWYAPLLEFATGNFSLVLATYWFVVSLVTMQLACYVLGRTVRNRSAMALVCGAGATATLFIGYVPFLCLTATLQFLPFFALGCFACGAVTARARWRNVCLIALGEALYFALANITDTETGYSVGEALAGCAVCAVVCGGAVALSRTDSGTWAMQLLRYGALVLLATQNYIIGLCRVFLDKVSAEHDFLASHFVLKPLVFVCVYVVTVPVIILVKRKCPCILGRRTAPAKQ